MRTRRDDEGHLLYVLVWVNDALSRRERWGVASRAQYPPPNRWEPRRQPGANRGDIGATRRGWVDRGSFPCADMRLAPPMGMCAAGRVTPWRRCWRVGGRQGGS